MLWPIRFREEAGIWPGGSYRPAPWPVWLPWWTIQECPWGPSLVAKGVVSQGVISVAADIWIVFAAIHPRSSPCTVVMHISHWAVQDNLPWQTQPAGIQGQSPRDKQSTLARIPPSVRGGRGHWSGLVFDVRLSIGSVCFEVSPSSPLRLSQNCLPVSSALMLPFWLSLTDMFYLIPCAPMPTMLQTKSSS